MALDDELKGVFVPSLGSFGFALSERQLPSDPFDVTNPAKQTVSVAIRPGLEFFLICVPSKRLDAARRYVIKDFTFLSFTFPKNSIVYILSRGLPAIGLPFRNNLDDHWRRGRGMMAEFIPWPDIESLLKAQEAPIRRDLIGQILNIPQLEKRTEVNVGSAPTPLSIEERNTVVELLANRVDDPLNASQVIYLNDFVDRAGFRKFRDFQWEGGAEINARKLVTWAAETVKSYPGGHERAGQNTLGWLIKTIIEDQIDPKDAEKLAKMVLDHSLISDQKAIVDLRSKLPAQGR
jgi:hypothetical protein